MRPKVQGAQFQAFAWRIELCKSNLGGEKSGVSDRKTITSNSERHGTVVDFVAGVYIPRRYTLGATPNLDRKAVVRCA